LTSREKKWSIPFVLTSFFLFVVGALFAYYTLPRALGFLLGFAGPGVVSLLTFDRYVSFVMLVALAFGLSFLLPILLVFLELIGVVTPQWLSKNRRYAIFLIFLFAAIVTPSSDPYTMTAMAVPMYLLYEVAIIVGRVSKRGAEATLMTIKGKGKTRQKQAPRGPPACAGPGQTAVLSARLGQGRRR